MKRLRIAHPPIQEVMANVYPIKENPKHKKSSANPYIKNSRPNSKRPNFFICEMFFGPMSHRPH
jgi:hypothetical protein